MLKAGQTFFCCCHCDTGLIQGLQDKAQVFKVKADSTATAIEVTTEDTGNGKDFIVTSGLNEGDQIVTTGANNVTEGQKVLYPKEEVKSE